MKGWMFFTSDGQFDFRTEDFLGGCPDFFQNNSDAILWVSRFDTEDMPLMLRAFQGMAVLNPKNLDIQKLCNRINFDFNELQAYADKIRSES